MYSFQITHLTKLQTDILFILTLNSLYSPWGLLLSSFLPLGKPIMSSFLSDFHWILIQIASRASMGWSYGRENYKIRKFREAKFEVLCGGIQTVDLPVAGPMQRPLDHNDPPSFSLFLLWLKKTQKRKIANARTKRLMNICVVHNFILIN